jgi:uncharacterized protein (DUF924 family)
MNYSDVLSFWFEQVPPKDWFRENETLDLKMVEKFIVVHSCAVSGELFEWRAEPLGRLAEILLIDQFSRNIYRDDPKAYLSDSTALILAQEVISNNIHKSFETNQLLFLYMPFMHSESKMIHQIAMQLFSTPGLEATREQALIHKKIIDQFGRFPERNIILGRPNSPAEEIYLQNLANPPHQLKEIYLQ